MDAWLTAYMAVKLIFYNDGQKVIDWICRLFGGISIGYYVYGHLPHPRIRGALHDAALHLSRFRRRCRRRRTMAADAGTPLGPVG